MKELSIEEKAKRYDKAIELVNSKWHYKNQPCVIDVSEIFPELKESEDDNMWKLIKKYIHYNVSDLALEADHITREHLESWLERQSKQKSVDNAEPKFKVGDWAAENEPNNYAHFIHILEIINVQGKDRYRISRDIHNDEDIVDFDFVEKYYHKFDIKDAMDSDVLVKKLKGE